MLRPPLREINDTLDQIVLGAAIEADKPRFRFIVADDNPEHAWQTAITADETHQFLDAITAIAGAIVVPERRGVQLSAAPDISFCPIPDATLTTEESVETPPRLLSGKLEYPESQRLQNRSGRVLVQFVIDTTGRVAPQSECVLITDHEDFTAAVLRALPRFRFKPGTAGGIRVPVSVCQEYRFSIGRP